MLKWVFSAALLVGLYYVIAGVDALDGADAALVITGIGGFYGLLMLGLFLGNNR